MDYQSFDDKQIKHLEMIQAVVARLAGNSFLIKGWALTLTGAFLGFAVNKSSSGLAAAALIPIVFFWGLDTYYLRAERLFTVSRWTLLGFYGLLVLTTILVVVILCSD